MTANDKKDKKIAVFGLFDNRSQLEAAIDGLRTEGFRESDMSALLPDMAATKEVAHEKHTKAPEGALAGAAAGGVLGGTLGLLVGFLVATPLTGVAAKTTSEQE